MISIDLLGFLKGVVNLLKINLSVLEVCIAIITLFFVYKGVKHWRIDKTITMQHELSNIRNKMLDTKKNILKISARLMIS